MRPNVEFRVDLPKTNPGLAKPHLQRHVSTRKKPPLTTFKEEERTKNTKNTRRTWRTKNFQQAYSQRFIVIPFQRSLIHSSAKLKDILCSNQNHITAILIKKYFKEIESEDHSFIITENCTTYSSIQIQICETILCGINFSLLSGAFFCAR